MTPGNGGVPGSGFRRRSYQLLQLVFPVADVGKKWYGGDSHDYSTLAEPADGFDPLLERPEKRLVLEML